MHWAAPATGSSTAIFYVAGGRDANNAVLNSLYDYNIATNTWTTDAQHAEPRQRAW